MHSGKILFNQFKINQENCYNHPKRTESNKNSFQKIKFFLFNFFSFQHILDTTKKIFKNLKKFDGYYSVLICRINFFLKSLKSRFTYLFRVINIVICS